MRAHYFLAKFSFWLLMICGVRSDILNNEIVVDKPKQCPAGDGPVCATNGLFGYVLFPNACLFAEAVEENFLGAQLKEISLSHCINDCNALCTMEYKPLCGWDRIRNVKRIFRNHCDMIRESCMTNTDWQYFKDGDCEVTQYYESTSSTSAPSIVKTKRKPVPCPKIFNPVCATFAGVKSSFINECLVNAENIKTGKEWTIFSSGVCAEDYIKRVRRNTKTDVFMSENKFDNFDPETVLGDDVTYIYTPPVFQTQFIDQNPVSYKVGNYNKPRHFSHITNLNDGYYSIPLYPKRRPASTVPSPRISRPQPFMKPLYYVKPKNIMDYGKVLEPPTTVAAPTDGCKLICGTEYKPICVSRNNVNYTMTNECVYKSAMCRDRKSVWKTISEGRCETINKKIIKNKYKLTVPGFRFTSDYGIETPTTQAQTLPWRTSTPRTTTIQTTIRPKSTRKPRRTARRRSKTKVQSSLRKRKLTRKSEKTTTPLFAEATHPRVTASKLSHRNSNYKTTTPPTLFNSHIMRVTKGLALKTAH